MLGKQTLLLASDRGSRISYRIASLRILYIVTSTNICKATQFLEIILIFNIWKTARASEKWSTTNFIEVNIGHRMVTLQTLFIVTLTSISKVKNNLEIVINIIWKAVRARDKRSSKWGWYLLSNGVSSIFISRDLYLIFQGQKFKMLIYRTLAQTYSLWLLWRLIIAIE